MAWIHYKGINITLKLLSDKYNNVCGIFSQVRQYAIVHEPVHAYTQSMHILCIVVAIDCVSASMGFASNQEGVRAERGVSMGLQNKPHVAN